MRPRTHRANKWSRSVTSFCYVPITDPPLTTEKSVLLVHNISDADIARAKGEVVRYDKDDSKEKGKPGKFGLPGGGVKEEDFENPAEAARNEFEGETGLHALTVKPFLMEAEYKGFRIDRNGDTVGNPFYFERGQRPSVELARGEEVVENPIYLSEATVDWMGSKLRQVLLEAKKDLLSHGFAEEELSRDGFCVWLDEMDHILAKLGVDTGASVNIDELIAQKGIVETTEKTRSRARAALYLGIIEFDEIDGLGIFPLHTLLGEIYEEERRKPQGQRVFYPSHLRRLRKGFKEKGCLGEILGAI